jgi:hypothetical protein
MTDRIARLRVRSVRMKNGGASIRVLRDTYDYAADVRGQVLECLSAQGPDIAGFSFVVWGRDGGSTCAARANMRSQIPPIMIPEFVKARLMAEEIVKWSVEAVDKK